MSDPDAPKPHSSADRSDEALSGRDGEGGSQSGLDIVKAAGLKTSLDEIGLKIVSQLYVAVKDLKDATPCLLGLIGGWGDTLDDADVLDGLKRLNEMGECFIPGMSASQPPSSIRVGSERTIPSDADTVREALGDLIETAEILLHAAETKYIRESASFFKQYGMLPSLEAAQASVSRAKEAIAALPPDDGRRG